MNERFIHPSRIPNDGFKYRFRQRIPAFVDGCDPIIIDFNFIEEVINDSRISRIKDINNGGYFSISRDGELLMVNYPTLTTDIYYAVGYIHPTDEYIKESLLIFSENDD